MGDSPWFLQRGAAVSIPIPAPTQLLHVHGRGTADDPAPIAPVARTIGSDRPSYSSHDCIGDLSTVKPRSHRACVLRNVCMDTASGGFFYYRDPAATQAPVLFDRRYGHIFAFGHVAPKGGREDMLPLNKHVRYKRHVRWSPTILDAPMPASAPFLRQLHLLSAPFVPTNLGHLAWEEAFPLLLAMAQLGEYEEASKAVVLRTHACNETVAGGGRGAGAGQNPEPPSPSEARLCNKFVDGFVRPIGEVRTVGELRREHARTAGPGGQHVCFSRVLAGGFFEMFNAPEHPGKEPWLQLYRHRVLRFHGLAPPRGLPTPPSSHSLLLVRKQGRRGIHNLDEVLAYAQGGCGGLCRGLGKDNVRVASFETMTIRQQLELVSTSTLALSPPGGCSMVLPFLPEGAHAILVNYMLDAKQDTRRLRGAEGTCAKCSLTMEASLWRHVRHVRQLQYQVWEPSDFARGRPGREASVVIKLPRLAYLLRVALDAMAPRGGSYT